LLDIELEKNINTNVLNLEESWMLLTRGESYGDAKAGLIELVSRAPFWSMREKYLQDIIMV